MNQSYQNNDVTLGEWIITYLIMCVPVVNLIMLFVWAFGGNTKPSKANWCKAALIFAAIGTVIGILVGITGGLAAYSMY